MKTQVDKNKNAESEIISTHIVSSRGKLSCYLNILSLFALASSWLRSTKTLGKITKMLQKKSELHLDILKWN